MPRIRVGPSPVESTANFNHGTIILYENLDDSFHTCKYPQRKKIEKVNSTLINNPYRIDVTV